MTRTKSTYLALLAVLLSPMAANANLIVNGSFEVDPFTANGNYELGLIGNDVTGWFIPAGDGVYPWGLQDGAFGAFTPFGEQFFVLGRASTGIEYSIQQTLTGLIVGAVYDLAFSIASELGCCSQAEVSFLSGSSTGAQVFTALSSGNFWTDWSTYNMSFVASASSVTLQFKNVNLGGGIDLGLDNVSVFASTSVPEPGTLVLLGIGLLGMGAARRRKKA
jgi:Protein of unknown function (DUF642)/PEP-CTERM motif